MPISGLRALLVGALTVVAAAASAADASTPPRLVSASVPASPLNAQSGGIAAFDVTVDESGAVAGVQTVQDFAPFGDVLRDAIGGWRFEPAHEQGKAARSRVLVLGFFRPPDTAVIAPPRPRYKDTVAPDEIPWPTSVTVPPYPPGALGSGKVVLEVDVSAEGKVASPRVLTPASAFDAASTETAQAWAFRPASHNGRPVAARAYFMFSFVGTTR
jgi:TonB family protein